MSSATERIQFLRQQQADLQHWLNNWPLPARYHARKKKTRQNLERVTMILRDLAVILISNATRATA